VVISVKSGWAIVLCGKPSGCVTNYTGPISLAVPRLGPVAGGVLACGLGIASGWTVER